MAVTTCSRQRWRWLVLAATILGSMIADPMALISGLYLIPWKEYFNCSITEVSLIASVCQITYHLGGLSGIWVNRIGYRSVVIIGGLMTFSGFLISAFVQTRPLMCFTFGYTCFFAGTTFPAFNVALVSYFSKNFSTIRGLSSAGTGLGIFTIPAVLQFSIDRYGWQGSLLVMSAITSHLVVAGMIMRPDSFWARTSSRANTRYSPILTGASDNARHRSDESSAEEIKSNNGCELNCVAHAPDGYMSTNLDSPEPRPSCVENDGQTYLLVQNVLSSGSCESTNCDIAIHDNVRIGGSCENEDSDESEINSCETDHLPCDSSEVAQVISLGMNPDVSRSLCHRFSSVAGLTILIHSYRMCFIVFTQIVLLLSYATVMNHIPASVMRRGIDSQSASFLLSIIGIGSIVGRALNGFAIDSHCVTASHLYQIATVTFGAAVVLFRAVTIYWLSGIICVVIGASSGAAFSLMVVLAREYVGKRHMARGISLLMLSCGIGGTIGPTLGGWLYDTTNTYDASFYAVGAPAVVTGLLYLVLEPVLRRAESARAKKSLERLETSRRTGEET